MPLSFLPRHPPIHLSLSSFGCGSSQVNKQGHALFTSLETRTSVFAPEHIPAKNPIPIPIPIPIPPASTPAAPPATPSSAPAVESGKEEAGSAVAQLLGIRGGAKTTVQAHTEIWSGGGGWMISHHS